MIFWRKNDDRVLVIGIFQSPKIGRAVLKNLHRVRFRRAAAIHAPAKGRPRVEENGVSMIDGFAGGAAVAFALGAFIFGNAERLSITRRAGWRCFSLPAD